MVDGKDWVNARRVNRLSIVIFVVIVAIVAIIGAVILIFHDYKHKMAEELVKAQSKIVVRTHGKGYEPPNDPWGSPLEWRFEPGPKVHTADVLSAGPDKIVGTDDDIHHMATDFNKTGIVAEWAGSKVKEGIKGFFRGLRNPSSHMPEDE